MQNATSNKCIIGYVEKKWTYTKIQAFLKNDVDKVVKFFSSSYNSKDSKLYLYINDELQCVLKKETWYWYGVTNTGDTILLTVVSENGFRTTKTIINQSVNAEVYLIIDK